jgi:hypothetical protein
VYGNINWTSPRSHRRPLRPQHRLVQINAKSGAYFIQVGSIAIHVGSEWEEEAVWCERFMIDQSDCTATVGWERVFVSASWVRLKRFDADYALIVLDQSFGAVNRLINLT